MFDQHERTRSRAAERGYDIRDPGQAFAYARLVAIEGWQRLANTGPTEHSRALARDALAKLGA